MTIPEPYRNIIEGARAFQAEASEILTRAERSIESPSPEVKRPMLIGMGGRLRAGKDTFADFLVADYGFQKLGMSDPLAHALYTLNPYIDLTHPGYEAWAAEAGWAETRTMVTRYRDLNDIVGYAQAKKIPEVRRLLQVLGTEVGRMQLDENIWTRAVERSIEEIRAAEIPVILTGIRYENERDLIDRLGGILIWIEREGAAGTASAVVRAIDDALDPQLAAYHSSEVTLTREHFHIVVHNDGTLEDLHQRAHSLTTALQKLAEEPEGTEGSPEA